MMEHINVGLLAREYEKLEYKIEQIDNLPRLRVSGNSDTGIEIDQGGVHYHTCETLSGCSKHYTLFVRWDEINKPIEYFRVKFRRDIIDSKKTTLRQVKQ